MCEHIWRSVVTSCGSPILLFDRLTALDAVGFEVYSRLPGAELDFVAAKPGTVRTDTDRLGLEGGSLDRRGPPAPGVVLVPGGRGTRPLLRDEPVLAWLRSAHEGTRFTSSACTGALVLGAARNPRRAARHDPLGVPGHPQRVRRHPRRRACGRGRQGDHGGRRVVGDRHGPAPGSETRREDAAKAIQLGIEYDPRAPVRRRLAAQGARQRGRGGSRLEDLSDLPSRRPANGGYARRNWTSSCRPRAGDRGRRVLTRTRRRPRAPWGPHPLGPRRPRSSRTASSIGTSLMPLPTAAHRSGPSSTA